MTRRHTISEGVRTFVTNSVLMVLGLVLVWLTHELTVEFDHFRIGFAAVAGWSIVVYAAAATIVMTQPTDCYTMPVLLGIALACRVTTLTSAPFLSSDIYRYVWDGIVQHAHISPYRYVPGDPSLGALQAAHPAIFEHINRRNYARTIYPPLAQILFAVVTFFSASVIAMKLAMILFEGVTVYALARLLSLMGRNRNELLLYAWCPLLLWEIGSSGHVDAAVIAFLSLALLARARQHPVATGLYLGAAVLLKLYPIVLFPSLWRRRSFKMVFSLTTLIVASYACYASVGWKVLGFLGGYVQEEGMQSGERYFFLQLLLRLKHCKHVSLSAEMMVVLLILGALAVVAWLLRRHRAALLTCCRRLPLLPEGYLFIGASGALGLSLMLLFSPHYPWYVAWLIPFAVLLRSPTLFVYSLGLFYLCATSLGAGTVEAQYQLNCVLYLLTFISGVVEICVRVHLVRRGEGYSQ